VKKIYLRGALGVDKEMPGYTVKGECKRNKLRVKAEKRTAKFGDTNGMLKRKENKEKERERNTIIETGMPVKKWKH
jgi:hypothetical protein